MYHHLEMISLQQETKRERKKIENKLLRYFIYLNFFRNTNASFKYEKKNQIFNSNRNEKKIALCCVLYMQFSRKYDFGWCAQACAESL